jgi:catechol 2,3-dioxygenase-like lactoylglutathione lyase family enzyme
MKILLTSVFVDDQAKAVAFYTGVLGFVKRKDIPVGRFRFLTVASPEGPEGVELLLEPNVNPAARTYQRAIYAQGIPAATFFVEDIESEYARLTQLGVAFTSELIEMATGGDAVFDDTCGNLIGLQQI